MQAEHPGCFPHAHPIHDHRPANPQIGRNDEYLLTNSLLRNNALVMTLGGKGRATKGLTQHHRQDGPQAEITLNSKSFYDNFLPECHDIFNKIKAEEIANAELPYCRQNNWLLEPLVVRLMADCYGQIKRTNADQGALAEYINPTSPRW